MVVLICIFLFSIFSCAFWKSVCLLWRNVCLGVLPIFDWAFQRKEIMPLAAMWMGLETVILGKVNQRGKEKYSMMICSYVKSKKKFYKSTYLEKRNRDLENKFMVIGGKGGGKG